MGPLPVSLLALGAVIYSAVNSTGWVLAEKNRLAYGIPIWISLVIKKEFKDADKARIPVDLVPAEMKEISLEIICKGLMYKITFIKP